MNVCGVTKPVLGNVIWSHTIFWFFETFCEDVFHYKLCVSTNFIILDLQIKSYGCLKFLGEVSIGRACAIANQQELTTSTQKGGQHE